MRSVIKAEIFRLNGARPIEFALQLIYAWAVIIGAIYMALVLNNWFAYIIAGIIVATRQNVLALLVHEQAHDLGFKGRLGDLVVNLLAAYPLLFTLEGYANVHLAHHKFYFTDKDPDFQRKSGKEWETPISKVYLLRLVLADIAGMNVIKLARGKSASGQFKHPFPSWVRLIYYVASAAVLVQNWVVLALWVLPILTIFQVMVRCGALCEHKYNMPNASVEESTPLILLRWWEKLLMPNLNFSLHPYHHYFPGIAFCNLPKVHAIYEREHIVQANVFHGYGQYFRYLTK